jgi:hypothetical protein
MMIFILLNEDCLSVGFMINIPKVLSFDVFRKT